MRMNVRRKMLLGADEGRSEGGNGGAVTTYSYDFSGVGEHIIVFGAIDPSSTAFDITLEVDPGYKISIVKVTMGRVDVTARAYDSSTGKIYIEVVTGNIVVSASAVADTVEPEAEQIYLFDSTRSDNLLFGEYILTSSSDTITLVSTAWPPTGDTLSTSSQIVLDSKYSMFTYHNAKLTISPNNVEGTWEGTTYASGVFFTNNVVYGNLAIGTGGFGIPGTTATLCFKAYRTQNGTNPTVSYMNGSSTISSVQVTGTTAATYSMDITFVSGGTIVLSAANNCGNFVITDIWFENIKS